MLRPVLAALALTSFAAPALADPAASGALPTEALLKFYPAGARAAGIEGSATLRCGADARLALKDCVVVEETPADHGFGKAALAMAALSKDNPRVAVSNAASTPQTVFMIRFALNPPAITPNVTGWRHVVVHPDIARGPTPRDMLRAFPQAAVDARADGEAKLDCVVTLAGALTGCQVTEEAPPNLGFGAAALKLAPAFVMTPETYDGDAVDGGKVTVPIVFRLGAAPGTAPPPDAPATNGAAP